MSPEGANLSSSVRAQGLFTKGFLEVCLTQQGTVEKLYSVSNLAATGEP